MKKLEDFYNQEDVKKEDNTKEKVLSPCEEELDLKFEDGIGKKTSKLKRNWIRTTSTVEDGRSLRRRLKIKEDFCISEEDMDQGEEDFCEERDLHFKIEDGKEDKNVSWRRGLQLWRFLQRRRQDFFEIFENISSVKKTWTCRMEYFEDEEDMDKEEFY